MLAQLSKPSSGSKHRRKEIKTNYCSSSFWNTWLPITFSGGSPTISVICWQCLLRVQSVLRKALNLCPKNSVSREDISVPVKSQQLMAYTIREFSKKLCCRVLKRRYVSWLISRSSWWRIMEMSCSLRRSLSHHYLCWFLWAITYHVTHETINQELR